MAARRIRGFTLVELLVVISIIAILALIGLTIYSGLQKGARDSRRKADVDSIAAALESRFDQTTATYPDYSLAAADSWFGQSTKPKKPDGTSYTVFYNPGNSGYQVCVILEDGTTQFCRSSSQAAYIPTPPPVAEMITSNGGFENPGTGNPWLNPWGWKANGTAAATNNKDTVDFHTGGTAAMRVDITASGFKSSVQLSYPNLSLTSGTQYTLKFWAKANAARPFSAALAMATTPFTIYGQTPGSLNLTTSWAQYQLTFVSPATDPTATLQFSMGELVSNVWIDDVSLMNQ